MTNRQALPRLDGAFSLRTGDRAVKNKTVADCRSATGAVGREFMGCIEQRGIPPQGALELLASARVRPARSRRFRGQELTIEELKDDKLRRRATLRCSRPARAFPGSMVPLPPRPAASWWTTVRLSASNPAVPAGGAGDQCPPHGRSQGHHRQSQLRRHHHTGAALAGSSRSIRVRRLIVSTYQAASGGGARGDGRCSRSWSTRAYPRRQALRAQGHAASLCLQRFQPQHGHRSADRLQ